MMQHQVRDLALAPQGHLKISWAREHMPVLATLVSEYATHQPLRGQRIAGCLHVTKETAVLVEALVRLGANVSWCGCNPLSTQDDVAAALADQGISVFAWRGMNREEFYLAIDATLALKPTITVDDGADLITRVHTSKKEYLPSIIGGTEETTTGIHRLRMMANSGVLAYPVVAVNDAATKWEFDNVYGTGQSSWDGVLRATNVLVAGKVVVIAGYGHCGRGCAMRAKGMGARVIITEVCPIAALKAMLEGFWVMPMDEAAKVGDIFVTATGMKDVICGHHMAGMKDGAIVCNTGHYDCEVNVAELARLSSDRKVIRPHCEEYTRKDGKKIFLLAEGRLVNLAAAEGHPSEVMDMSFANQLLAMIWLSESAKTLASDVHLLPMKFDERVAFAKLHAMGASIDRWTPEQEAYAKSYLEGT